MDFRQLPPSLLRRATTAHPHRFRGPVQPGRGQVAIDGGWALVLADECGPLTRLAAADFRTLMATTFGRRLQRSAARSVGRIEVTSGGGGGGAGGTVEGFGLVVERGRVRIDAESDEGGMRALFHLGRRMLEARGPLLQLGRTAHRPRWALRIGSPLLHRARDTPQDYLDLPPAYLLNMARYGYNATYLYADWFDYMPADLAGPLARPGAKDRLRQLQRAAEYLGGFGIRLLFHVNTLALPGDHRLFAARPEMRGAQTWQEGLYCLCSSEPAVLELYRTAAERLFREAPALAGAVLLVGGECLLHCHTRPSPRPNGNTNCPRCRRRPPERVIASVVNAITRGARTARADARVLVWPYSAFSWGDLSAQKRLVAALEPGAEALVTFEKDQWLSDGGARSYVFDYSISQLGPSPRFRALRSAAEASGRRFWARTETSNAIEIFNVPRIPVMHRWAARWEAVRRADVEGVHSAWRFYGFCAQRTDELLDHYAWDAKPDGAALLDRLAARDFGTTAAPGVVAAWRRFSDAFARFPYAAGVTGFPYFRGPFVLGPAHPLVFDLTQPLGLSGRFWAADPSIEEALADPEGPRAERQPLFFMDLTWTQPLGAVRVERRLAEMDRGWRAGMDTLTRAGRGLRGDQRRAWQDEFGVAATIGSMCRTALNLVRLQQLRLRTSVEPSTPATLLRTCRAAQRILADELAQATAVLPIVREESALGYGATYGRSFDADLIEEKLEHTRRQLHIAVPAFFQNHMFHAFGRNEDL